MTFLRGINRKRQTRELLRLVAPIISQRQAVVGLAGIVPSAARNGCRNGPHASITETSNHDADVRRDESLKVAEPGRRQNLKRNTTRGAGGRGVIRPAWPRGGPRRPSPTPGHATPATHHFESRARDPPPA